MHRLCTFKEIMDQVPRNVAIHVDIKQESKTLVKSVLELVASHPRSAPTIILGAGNSANYVQMQRMMGRSRGIKIPCCRSSSSKEQKYSPSSSNSNNNNDSFSSDYDPAEWYDEHRCAGCCVLCCCC